MASYSVRFKRSAEKELRAIPRPDIPRVLKKIRKLENDPRPQGSQLLTGEERYFRLRQGNYRVVYGVDEDLKEVLIIRIAHRSEVYKP